jgi:hypothetical protein
MTRAEKRDGATAALREDPNRSDRAIATLIGASPNHSRQGPKVFVAKRPD